MIKINMLTFFLLMITCFLSSFIPHVDGQANTTCSPFKPSDSSCGVFAPLNTVLYDEQASSLSDTYLGQLSILCPSLITDSSIADVFPFMFCLGSMGPCNGASFKLPEVDAQGRPKDITDVGIFYNQAKFKELLPALEKANIAPPCYESCQKAANSVVTCPALSGVVSRSADPCEGLPSISSGVKCIQKPGTKSASVQPSKEEKPSNSKESSTQSDKSSSSNVHHNVAFLYLSYPIHFSFILLFFSTFL